ncbi:MAG: glycogen/starch synthase [Fimbriimonadaceae bacterium]
MKILFVSAEVAPFAKVGGLADVAGSLPRALSDLGHDIRIAMPAYRMVLDDPRWHVTPLTQIHVQIREHCSEEAGIRETNLASIPVYLVGPEQFSKCDRSETIYSPDVEAYILFAHAVLQLCADQDWLPDIVHCNDWQTGLIPVLMREKAGWNSAAIYTIHNLAYQGEFEPELIHRTGLPEDLFDMHRLETYGQFNFLKAGCAYADQVNTVSPTYSREIQTPQYGCRLEGLMAHLSRAGRLRGILNGIDLDAFNPETDPDIASNFSAQDPRGKTQCRAALLKDLGLEDDQGNPIMSVVSRLSSQKGIDLILDIAEDVLSLPGTLIIQGLGDPGIAERLRVLQAAHPSKVCFIERFDEILARRIYAGSDMFLMPSAFEPCGLGQMIAHRYGTIPIARHTGGLADTVFEPENGFVFQLNEAGELLLATERACKAFRSEVWPTLVQRAMRTDHGWSSSTREYEAMYAQAIEARQAARAAS